MALIGTISGSNGTTTSSVTGSLIIAANPSVITPIKPVDVVLYVSGVGSQAGPDTPSVIFKGDVYHSGGLGTSDYFQMRPVNTLRIPTNTTASYIYTSGSTNDMYFTQYNGPYTNTTRLRWLESQIQTGLLSGGTLSSVSGSTTYSILSGSGIIVTQNASLSTDPYPTIAYVSWPTLSGLSLPSLSSTQITYVAMDSTGTPFLHSVPFTDGDFEQYIVLGRILHTDKVGTNGAVSQPTVAYGASQFRGDFVRAFGPIKLSGHTFYVSGTTGLKKDAGDSYAEGRNYTVNPNSPNYVLSTSDTAQDTSKIFYEYVNASGDDVILNNGNLGYSAVDFANYNNAGVLTTVGTGNKFTIQRVYWFPNAVNRAFYVYYGNTIYATIADAQAGISTETFTEGKNTRDAAIFLGYLIVKGTGVNFTDPTTYKIIQAGAFRAVGASGASGASGSPGGSDTYVQFNDAGVFNGTSDFKFAKGTGTVSMANLIVSGTSAGALVTSGALQVKSGVGAVVGSISTGGVISGSGDLQVGGNITGSNQVLSGDIAVNGGDITTTSTTFNLVNGTATTVALGGAATTVSIGASSGRTTIAHDLAIGTGTIIGAPGAGANVMTLVSSGNIIAKIDTDNSVEGHKFAVQDYRNIDQFWVGENGNAELSGSLTVTGSVAVNGGSLTTTSSTFNLINANATTVNFAGGASTAFNIGNTAATNTVLGQTKFSQGLSGSHTKLTDGTSYITQGVNVSVVTASNGSISIASNNIPLSFLGDASDGSATLDGVATFTWASLAGSVYTMTRDALLRDLTINNTITLRTQGFLPYVKGTLTNNGVYEAKGNDASGASVGGALNNIGSFSISAGSGGSGGGPTTGNAVGNPGNGSGGNSIGGTGGNGGAVGASAGGAGNSSAAPAATLGSWRDLGFLVRRRLYAGATVNSLNGSGGGGGGAVNGDGVNSGTGGGGGGAAPNCYVFCDTLNNAGTIRAIGGNGGNGVFAGGTTKAGGGGGGAGGGVIVAANTVTALGTVASVGGSFGSGANGGGNGSPGTAGTVLILTGS